VLITASDFEPTSELAVAFAYLILLSAVLTVGPVVADRINSLIAGSVGSGGEGGGGGGRATTIR
jgi:hypothetical protein